MKLFVDMDPNCPHEKRAIRRHHRNRIVLRRLRRRHWHAKSPGHLSKNNTVCSCWMCGNPRKYFGEATAQEKKFISKWSEEIGQMMQRSYVRKVDGAIGGRI